MLALQKMSLATFHNNNIKLGLHFMFMSRLHALYFLLHTSYSMCMYLYSACFSGSYIHLMSTTQQLDRSRSPTMPCILLVVLTGAKPRWTRQRYADCSVTSWNGTATHRVVGSLRGVAVPGSMPMPDQGRIQGRADGPPPPVYACAVLF